MVGGNFMPAEGAYSNFTAVPVSKYKLNTNVRNKNQSPTRKQTRTVKNKWELSSGSDRF